MLTCLSKMKPATVHSTFRERLVQAVEDGFLKVTHRRFRLKITNQDLKVLQNFVIETLKL